MEIEEEKTHLLTDEIKWVIVHYKKKGLSNKVTASVVGNEYDRPSLSHQTVKKVWMKYEDQGNVYNKWNEHGRPQVVTEREERRILDFVSLNRNASVSEIQEELDLDFPRTTINDVLLRNSYRAYSAPKKLLRNS